MIEELGAALRARKMSVRELVREALRRAAESQARLNAFVTITEDRALARAAELDTMLERWDADRMVVGHTVNSDYRITPRLAGRVFLIDTGMLAPVFSGTPSALELIDGRARAMYADGRVEDLIPTRP